MAERSINRKLTINYVRLRENDRYNGAEDFTRVFLAGAGGPTDPSSLYEPELA